MVSNETKSKKTMGGFWNEKKIGEYGNVYGIRGNNVSRMRKQRKHVNR